MQHKWDLDMVTELIQGVVAGFLVGGIVTISIIEVLQGKPFSEPVTLSALAGAAVGFYYGQRNQRRQQDVISDLTSKIVNGNGSNKPSS